MTPKSCGILARFLFLQSANMYFSESILLILQTGGFGVAGGSGFRVKMEIVTGGWGGRVGGCGGGAFVILACCRIVRFVFWSDFSTGGSVKLNDACTTANNNSAKNTKDLFPFDDIAVELWILFRISIFVIKNMIKLDREKWVFLLSKIYLRTMLTNWP